MKRLARPAQHRDRFNDGQRRGIVRPCAAIGQADRILCDVVTEVRRRRSGRQASIDCQRFVVVAKTRVMCGLVDINGARDRVPCRDEQPRLSIADPFASKHIFQNGPQRCGIVFVSE